MSNKIENIFKDKFENYESAPSAGLFEAIIDKRAQKKRVILWYWAATAAVITAAIIMAVWPSSTGESEASRDLSTLQTPSKPQTAEQELMNEVPELVTNKKKSTTAEEIKIPLQKGSPKNASSTSSNKQTYAKPTIPNSNIGNDIAAPKQADKVPTIGDQKLADRYNEIVAKNKNADPTKTKIFTTKGELNVETNRTPAATRENQPKAENPKIETNQPTEAEELETNKINDPIAEASEPANTPLPVHKLNKYSGWSIEIAQGLGMGTKQLSGNKEYVTLRRETDKNRLSYSAELAVGYQITPKWTIITGVNLVKRNEKFTYTSPEQELINSRDEVRTETVIHPVLGTYTREYIVTIRDTAKIPGITTAQANSYTTISIPLYAERLLWSQNKWNLWSKVGVLTSINQKANGVTISTENGLQELSTLTFKKMGVTSVNVGLGASYDATDRVQITLYPQGRYGLNNSLIGQAYQQRELGIYTQLGLRFRL